MTNYFPINLKYLRNERGLSQEQLAFEIGLNRGNVASYEKGTAEPSIRNVIKIVKYFNIELIDMVEKDVSISKTSKFDLSAQTITSAEIPEHNPGLNGFSALSQIILNHSSHAIELQRIITGFRSFYEYRKAKGTSDPDKVIRNYEDLLELVDELMAAHHSILSELQQFALQQSNESY